MDIGVVESVERGSSVKAVGDQANYSVISDDDFEETKKWGKP